MFSKICLNVLIGLPGSGKTHYSNQLLHKSRDCVFRFNVVKISFDDYYTSSSTFNATTNSNSISGAQSQTNRDSTNTKVIRKKILQLIEVIIKDLNETDSITSAADLFIQKNFKITTKLEKFVNTETNSPCVIIIDDNNYYKSMRYEFLQIAKTHNLGFFQTYFDCELTQCLVRNKCRPESSRIEESVIVKMNSKLEKPSESDVNTLKLRDNYTLNIDELTAVINKSLANPEQRTQLNQERVHVAPSELHKVDLILRKEINALMKEATNKNLNLREFSLILNTKRREILQNIKLELVKIPEETEQIKMLLN